MPGLVISSTANSLKVEFNDFTGNVGYKKAAFQKREITFQLSPDESYIRVEDSKGDHWTVNYAINPDVEALTIDTVDGVAPISNSDLYDKLIALIA